MQSVSQPVAQPVSQPNVLVQPKKIAHKANHVPLPRTPSKIPVNQSSALVSHEETHGVKPNVLSNIHRTNIWFDRMHDTLQTPVKKEPQETENIELGFFASPHAEAHPQQEEFETKSDHSDSSDHKHVIVKNEVKKIESRTGNAKKAKTPAEEIRKNAANYPMYIEGNVPLTKSGKPNVTQIRKDKAAYEKQHGKLNFKVTKLTGSQSQNKIF
jgi:hypothetical protein